MGGVLVEGKWQQKGFDVKSGRFERPGSAFRNWVTSEGDAGPTGTGGFRAESGRYHLYVSYACPWAHRTLIMRHLKRLERVIDVSVVDPHMGDEGWSFENPQGKRTPGSTGDTLHGVHHLHQIYTLADDNYSGRVTVPVLWDKDTSTIVSNESADIVRMLNGPFSKFSDGPAPDLYPEDLRAQIDAVNDDVYPHVNNGVYRCGFASTQEAYKEAFEALFAALDRLEGRLQKQPYLAGDRLTEADVRLVTTLFRFDAVYYVHFKCNRIALREYPALWCFTKAMYALPGVAQTVDMQHIKTHYYWSHPHINPTRIVPEGPELRFD